MEKCLECGRKLTKKIEYGGSFKRGGMTFVIPALHGGGCRKCREAEIWKVFKTYEKNLIEWTDKDRSKYWVNWSYITGLSSHVVISEIMWLLESLGVLSLDMRKHWLILDGPCTTVLCPRSSSGAAYFFKSAEDAKEYANRQYGHAQYGFHVVYAASITAFDET